MWHNVSLNVSFITTQGDYTEYDSKQYLIFFLNLSLALRLVVPCYLWGSTPHLCFYQHTNYTVTIVKLLIPVKVYKLYNFHDHTIHGLLNKHAQVQARYIYILAKFLFSHVHGLRCI